MKAFKFVITSIFVILLTLQNAYAREWTPVVSGVLQYDVVFPLFNIESATNSGWFNYYACWGSTFDAELRTGHLGFHASYHYGGSPVYENMDGGENAWVEKRYLLGMRWYPFIEIRGVVKPVLGAALTAGHSRLMENEWQSNGFTSVSRRSKTNIGELFEFGVIFWQDNPVSAALMAQIHRTEADFGKTKTIIRGIILSLLPRRSK